MHPNENAVLELQLQTSNIVFLLHTEFRLEYSLRDLSADGLDLGNRDSRGCLRLRNRPEKEELAPFQDLQERWAVKTQLP